MAKPFGLAEKVRFDAVVPEAALDSNQFEPVLVLGATVTLMGVPSVLVSATFWNDEVVDPNGIENTRLGGLTTSSAVLLTINLTGIVCGTLLLTLGVTVTDPS